MYIYTKIYNRQPVLVNKLIKKKKIYKESEEDRLSKKKLKYRSQHVFSFIQNTLNLSKKKRREREELF